MTTIWPLCDFCMTTIWPLCDLCMTTIWPLCDFCITAIWHYVPLVVVRRVTSGPGLLLVTGLATPVKVRPVDTRAASRAAPAPPHIETSRGQEPLQTMITDNRGPGTVLKLVLCSVPSVSQSVFTITEKAPTRAFSWLKVPTSTFTFKTLLRHYAKWALTPR